MYKTFSMELAGRTLSVDVGRVAAQANGAAFMHYGETTVLSTATASEKPREGIDFFPLSVEFEEKLYAVGKIPGGFNKREGKASFDCDLLKHGQHKPRPSKGWSVGPLMLVGLPPHKRTDAGAVGIRRSGVLVAACGLRR